MYIAIRGKQSGDQIGIWGIESRKFNNGQTTLIFPKGTALGAYNEITIEGDRIIAMGEENLSLDNRMNPFVEHTSAAKHVVFESSNSDITSHVKDAITEGRSNPQADIITINPDEKFNPVDYPELGL